MKPNAHATPLIFGEVLFDCFPDGNSVLGGAPFNVAWHLQAFGMSPLVVSRIGDDDLGEQVESAMIDWTMSVAGLQHDSAHPTGSVDITFVDGEPRYSIVEHRAYDYIEAASLPRMPEKSLLYHGTLALRNPVSRETLHVLKAQQPGTLFMDVNLRDPWWDRNYVLELVDDADWVKLNQDELSQLGSRGGALEQQADEFMRLHELSGLVVTLGDKGAVAITDNGQSAEVSPAQQLSVVDTVGAGDAFTSVLITGLISEWPLEQTLQRAQVFASMIVGQQGATVHDRDFYQAMITDWHF
jgi:fructokinase